MLSFPTNLANELRDKSSAYWYIRLYYGAEGATDFTGMSDKDRVLNSVKYRGLVLNWGTLIHSVDLNSFTPSVLAMNGLTLSNVDDSISGGRFTDLFNTQNYVNRKWVLMMGADSVAYTDHVQIGQGIITDQIDQSSSQVTLSLLEDVSALTVEVPTNRVNTTDHPNAPENNFGKPIPMAYGDFGLKTDIGTIPTSGAEFDRYFVKGKFPAVITNKWDATNAYVIASPDAVTMSAMDNKNVYMGIDNQMSPCEDGNVTVSTATPQITFKGDTWRAYFTLAKDAAYDTGDYANTIDSEFDTTYTLTEPTPPGSTYEITTGWKIPKIPKLGEILSVNIMFDFGTFSGTAPVPSAGNGFEINTAGDAFAVTWNGGDQTINITSEFSAAEQSAWSFEKDITLDMDDTGGQAADQSYTINEVGIELVFTPSQTFTKEYVTTTVTMLNWGNFRRVKSVHTDTTPEITDYIYYAGKGREYGAWVDADSRNNGYNSGALIENPVYMIEDILRTELSLSSSNIDYASFDVAGNTTNGEIGNVFNLAVGSIEYAFSQYRFIDGWALCQEIAANCGCVLYQSGDGTVKITVRERDEDYTASDRTIKYDEMQNIKPGITPLGGVRNRITVNYDIDYASDTTTAITAITKDTTSQGSGATGINATQELIYDNRFTLDSDTAVGFSTYLKDIYAYRKKMLTFNISTPKHNDLEIGDTIAFSSFPSTFKIYGNTITATDIYMITQITKRPNGCSIICQEVSEVGD